MMPEEALFLKTVVSAGEMCPASVFERWQKSECLLNVYGPTEITICATRYLLKEVNQANVPVGKPCQMSKSIS